MARKYDPKKRRERYLREKAKAEAAGFTSPGQQTRARRAVRTGRVKTPEEYTYSVAKKEPFSQGVSMDMLKRMNAANKRHKPEGSKAAIKLQTYNPAKGIDGGFTRERIGYTVAFYRAVTDPASNFYSMSPSQRWVEENAESKLYKKWRDHQLAYLVRFGGFYSLDEFDNRYGDGPASTAIRNAMGL